MRVSVSAAPGVKPGQGVPDTSQHSAKFCFTLHAKFMQRSLPPPHSPLPGAPAHSAGPLQKSGPVRHRPPTLQIFTILGRLLGNRKTHQKTTPLKDTPKSQDLPKERPRHHFGYILGAFLASIFIKNPKQSKPLKMQQV
jgi:hypothetical protein